MAEPRALDFGELHFGRAQLGHEKRRKRLVALANQLGAHPDGTLPDKLRDPAAYQAMYRLCKMKQVTHAAVLQTHQELTREKMRAHDGIVLVIHDTTELDYTSKKSLHANLGQIGDGGGRGYECHNSLAVVANTREILGLANQILHRRADVPDKEGVAQKREREDRESLLWLRGSSAIGKPPVGSTWVDVCDRGADTFEFLDHEDQTGRLFVIRSNHNRGILIGHSSDGEHGLLHDYARTLPALGERIVRVGGRDGKPTRHANCLIAAGPVQILPPHKKRGNHRDLPLAVWVVRVWEIDPPQGETEPVEWILITNVPTVTLEDAVTRIEWYEGRWTIEEFHKAQKTGCRIEDLQFRHTERLEPMIALLSVVAVMLVNLRHAARQPELAATPAVRYVPESYVAVLSVWRYKERRTDLTTSEFYLALARLGGHQNRKSDGPPGWLTLWRGWNSLQQMHDYAIKAGSERSD
jgi:transposase-like protein